MRALTDDLHVHTTQQGTTVLMETRIEQRSEEAPAPALVVVPN
jgi:hypothetical protein